MADKYAFLSDEWFDAAAKLSDIKRTAGRLHRARAALKELDKGRPKPTRARGASS